MAFKLRDWFYEITQQGSVRGTRFKNGDRPTEDTFRNLTDSVVMKSDPNDRAKEDDGTTELALLNGHVVAATDAQAKANAEKPLDRTLTPQTSQLPTVSGSGDQELPDAPFNDETIEVEIDNIVSTRNNFIVRLSTGFLNLLNSIFPKLLPSGGNTGQYLAKGSNADFDADWVDPCCNNVVSHSLTLAEDIPDDADIVCIYDTSSFVDSGGDTPRTDATNLIETWYTNYVSSKPSFMGRLIQLEEASELWVDFGSRYIDETRSWTPVKQWVPDGSGGIIVEVPSPILDPVNKKIVMIVFIDESSPAPTRYTGTTAGTMQDPPVAIFRNDYNEFKNNQYGKYDFFRSIIYACQAKATPTGDTANLHSNVIQAIEPSTIVSAPFSYSVANAPGFTGTELDFITTNNFYEQAGDVDSPNGYSGLRNQGWSYVVDMPDGSVSSITNNQFAQDIESALAGTDGSKTVTITSTISLQDGTVFSDSIAFEVPV